MGYDAFISYSHAADDALAPAVQRALQTLARPWNKRRALEVFRDDTGLAVSPGLWTSICSGLDEAQHFVLLASPGAATSRWVNQEIEHWAESHSLARLLPVLTDGEWVWDARTGDFDWEGSTAVPPALRGKFSEEPRHLDLRWARSETDLDLRHARFREAMTQLAAPMHGLSPQDLESTDVARFRRLVRLRRAVVAALCTLLLLVSGAGAVAVQNARDARAQQVLAERQRQLAEEQARLSLSLKLLAQAQVVAPQDEALSLLLNAQAARLAPAEAWSSLVSGLEDLPGLTRIVDRPVGALGGTSVAVDTGGGTYAAADREGAISLWSLANGQRISKPLRDQELYKYEADQLTFSRAGDLAAVYSCSNTICGRGAGVPRRSWEDLGGIGLWDTRAVAQRNQDDVAEQDALLPRSGGSTNLAFSQAGTLLAATAPNGSIHVWDADTRKLLDTAKMRGAGEPTGLAFSPDDSMLAASQRVPAGIATWTITGGTLSRPAPMDSAARTFPTQIAFSSEQTVASLDNRGGVSLWRLGSGEPVGHLPAGGKVVTMAVSPGGTLATAGEDGSLRLWDAEQRTQVGTARPGGGHGPVEVQFTPDGALMSIGSDIRFWDVAGWERLGTELAHHSHGVTAMAVSPDGVVASGDAVGRILLWDLASGRLLATRLRDQHAAVTALAFSTRGMLGSGDDNGTVRLWDIETGAEVRTMARGHDGAVSTLAFAPGGATLATGYSRQEGQPWHRDDPVLLWNAATGRVIRGLDAGLSGGVSSIAFAPTGLFASAGSDHLAFWDAEDWQHLEAEAAQPNFRILVGEPRAGPFTAVAFSSDGGTLASSAVRFEVGDERTVVLWSMPAGTPQGEPLSTERVDRRQASFRALAFSPSDDLLVGAGDAGVQLWDVASQRPLGGRLGAFPTSSVVVSPDGRYVIAGDSDGVVQAYPATVEGWLDRVCDVVTRNLTLQEWDSFIPDTPYEKTCPGNPGAVSDDTSAD